MEARREGCSASAPHAWGTRGLRGLGSKLPFRFTSHALRLWCIEIGKAHIGSLVMVLDRVTVDYVNIVRFYSGCSAERGRDDRGSERNNRMSIC